MDLDALVRNIDTHLGPNPEPEEYYCTFCALGNILFQLMGDKPMPPESDFWDPSVPLPIGMRNAATLFELEIVKRTCRAFPPHTEFIGAADYAPTSIHNLLEMESCGSSSESSPGGLPPVAAVQHGAGHGGGPHKR